MTDEKRIYTIATAHLDTVWNWDFEYVINTCLPKTLDDNFSLFEKYPNYRFNFEGAYRYELFEEYYPEKFEQLKKYIADGRWNVTGSCYENGDVNVPSPELLFRNVLYGNGYFQKKFGVKSNDIFLPDCFGFGWALPAVAEHANLKGFSTQKLSWGSAYKIPFDIGLWYGSDGKAIFASLDSKSYCTTLKKVRTNPKLTKKLNKNIKDFDFGWTFGYHGVGDVGGAPKEESAKTVNDEVSQNDSSDIKVLSSSPTEFFDDLSNLELSDINKLPRWNNELLMSNHGVGSYTSRSFSKRCNRRGEELADMAERSSVIAMSVCAAKYPKTELDKAWKRIIAHTFHDDITGTSVERVYKRSWNDYILSLNQFSNVFEGASGEVVKNMDTSWTKGIAVVVSNSIEQPRMEPVDITIPAAGFKFVRVFDSEGHEVPSQVNYSDNNYIKATFCANVPSLGFKVFDVLYSYEPCEINTGVRIKENMLENYKYIVSIDKNGDICSIIDKTLDEFQILNKPIRFELNKYKGDKSYPAWEMKYKEVMKYPWEFAEKGKLEIVESGPARATIKVTQKVGKSTFTYYVSLSAGGNRVNVYNEIEWREFCRVLHNGFSFRLKNSKAVFDLGLGTIERKKADKNLYSVPAQKWADISDKNRGCGVSIFSDSKYGWIMKDERTLRLTVIHSPKKYYRNDSVQGMMDFGLNRYGYAIYSHKGDYTEKTQLNARFFNQPMAVFTTNKHEGSLGSEYSFGTISNDNVIIRAIKKSENTDEIIVRVNEGAGLHAKNTTISLGKGILSAREVYASEEEIGEATVEDGKLVFDLAPNEVKTFALTLLSSNEASKNEQRTVELPYNIKATTFNSDRSECSIPTVNVSIPSEIFPKIIECNGIRFETGDVNAEYNALICDGQKIKTSGNRLYFVAASLYGDKAYDFELGDSKASIKVQAINERIGGWDLYNLAETAFIKTDKLAWEFTHSHSKTQDNVASQLYFFMYEINTENFDEITLPSDKGLIILAATETFDTRLVRLNTALYDRVENRTFDYKMSHSEKRKHKKKLRRSKKTPNKS
ncbi:MAG: glycoside hydrolase family 38 C-terminal domain-containing protein [Clostridia bacterium]|nr:glycoside hydrolase family 38 C-terminal domain-containing protein [Clostridia bacterium]